MSRRYDQTMTDPGIDLPSDDQPVIYNLAGDHEGAITRLSSASLTLGRAPSRSPSLTFDDVKMSRDHAEFRRARGGGYSVEDCGSKNGTWHNGVAAAGEALLLQDVIRLGDAVLVYTVAPAGQSSRSRRRASSLVGVSRALENVRELIERLAPTDLAILLCGESGTGKEVAARGIHDASGRSGPFLAVNCAAIPAELMERELFGHLRGAFTGAQTSGLGMIAAAEGGTLFLDEIGELPLPLQAKLLRFLEDRSYRPLGGTRESIADVRIVAATNRDLASMTGRDAFRLDLYARLDEAMIVLPPLRERREDLVSLLRALSIRECGREFAVTSDFVEALALHDWPRNVRELAKLVRRIPHLREKVERFEVTDLPDELQQPLRKRKNRGPVRRPDPPTADELEALMREHEGNVSRVASALKRDRKQVYRWLEAHGIDSQRFRPDEP
ncbi:MAG: sigma 54-interacting transcriptional regulator [Myxococcales bacterium]|nr:sigma 54-interacting transcriptional regulator [Myxococcales bacterium]